MCVRQVPEHAAAWERVVEKHGLKPYTLDEFVNQSWDLCDMLLGGSNRKSGGSSSRPDDPYSKEKETLNASTPPNFSTTPLI